MSDSATSLSIAGTTVEPGSKHTITLPVARLATGAEVHLTLEVLHGRDPGPALWLSGALHGDEPIGVEVIRQVLERIRPKEMAGTVIAIPVVNVIGFMSESRYLPDRRDLNRAFPGSKRGSLAAQMANLFMTEVVQHCQYGIDFHCGSNDRSNYPNVRAQLSDPETRELAVAFGAPLMVGSKPPQGSLRAAGVDAGARVLLYEGGEAKRFDEFAVRAGVEGTLRVLVALGIWKGPAPAVEGPVREASRTHWVRAARGGIFRPTVRLGDTLDHKQPLGVITDLNGDSRIELRARYGGMVFGLRLSPLVYRGDAVAHIAELVE